MALYSGSGCSGNRYITGASFWLQIRGVQKKISQKEWIRSEFRNAKEKGIPVFVEGVLYDEEKEKDSVIVQEELPYMIDFESNESGKIIGINFNKISQF